MVSPTIVEASWATLAALITAPIVGLSILLIRMFGRGGRARLAVVTLRRCKADVITVVAFDVVGGALFAASILLLGVSRPPALINGFESSPVAAWAIVGALGPLVSTGILDRIPLRTLAEATVTKPIGSASKPVATDFTNVRRQAGDRIMLALYEEVRVCEVGERQLINVRARALATSGLLTFDDLGRELRAHSDEIDEPLPVEVISLLDTRSTWPIDSDAPGSTVSLIATALDHGLRSPVEVACRIAEATKSS